MGRIATGLQLAKQTFAVLKADKRLLMFPVMSAIACLFIFLVSGVVALNQFILPMLHQHQTQAEIQAGFHSLGALVGLFIFYLVNYFIIIFFNSALAASVIAYCRGQTPSVKYGLIIAWNNMEHILGWAMVSATVGLILHLIQDRSKGLGRLVEGLLGGVWNVVTFFVVPVLIIEQVGPFTALKKSMGIVKKTWGESLVSTIGLGLFMFLALIICLIPFGLGYLTHTPVGIGIGVSISVLLIIGLLLINSALTMILRGVLYLYAAEGKVSQHFDPVTLQAAFAKK